MEINNRLLLSALQNILSYQLKRDDADAPCSAQTHLNAAIVGLYNALGRPGEISEERQSIIDAALEEMELLMPSPLPTPGQIYREPFNP